MDRLLSSESSPKMATATAENQLGLKEMKAAYTVLVFGKRLAVAL